MIELGSAIHSGKMREDYDLHPPTAMGKLNNSALEVQRFENGLKVQT